MLYKTLILGPSSVDLGMVHP